METKTPLIVNAMWDEEAGVWVATSEDVPGLVAEMRTMEGLVEELKGMIPELLNLNDRSSDDEIPFQVNSQLTAVAHRHAA
ncbi:protein of unknown function [Nitrosospira sp. Nl5]|uniref:DUF1902 domain-containing protein n=1 Tax=Nitrosospira sp. Nl5 TaxID=200120 RepID=UPI0008814FFD|nr:DUF1902 domain-containing protein [Nitrosospira sp. Nl5]SCX93017.1 protein of unknown function [Nitrosospira sp. Nl5]